MKLSIVSGRSGSGKSICLKVLEDLGYYCIDNMPLALIAELSNVLDESHQQVAISIDARTTPLQLNSFAELLQLLKMQGVQYEIILMQADDQTIMRRFAETRRKHPLSSQDVSLQTAIQRENQHLLPITGFADIRIDSSRLSAHELRNILDERLKHQHETSALSLSLISFGFKHGTPQDADYIFDVRMLANPYWHSELTHATGKDPEVAKYLAEQETTQHLLSDLNLFLQTWIPHFENAHRRYLNIAIGCTGGQHRSVYIVEAIAAHLRELAYQVQVRHRELT